jgi:hypothetical protein
MDSWRQSYDELKDYVVRHPTIVINEREMNIPDDVRPEFYHLFDRVREQYIQEMYPALIPESSLLSASFAAAKEKTLACLKLKDTKINGKLQRFLQNPMEGLVCELFDPLFRVLQGITDLATFERVAADILKDSAKTFPHHGYLHWTTLSLMRLLAPDEVYFVPVPDETAEFDLSTGVTRPGWYTVEIPDMAPDEVLRLDVSPHTPVLVPKAIIHSSGLNIYAAIGTDFHEVYRRGFDLSKKIEWLNIAEIRKKFGIGDLWPDMCLYLHEEGKELRVVHDYYIIARPDIIIDVMETKDWYKTGGVESVKRHHEILRPRLGSFVVCREPLPQQIVKTQEPDQSLVPTADGAKEAGLLAEEASKPEDPFSGLPLDIHFLFAGYEADRLKPVIDAIAGYKTSTGE